MTTITVTMAVVVYSLYKFLSAVEYTHIILLQGYAVLLS